MYEAMCLGIPSGTSIFVKGGFEEMCNARRGVHDPTQAGDGDDVPVTFHIEGNFQRGRSVGKPSFHARTFC